MVESTFEKTRLDTDGNFNLLPAHMEVLWNRSRLEHVVNCYMDSNFCFPVTFTTHNNLVEYQPEHLGNCLGELIIDHMFFFEEPMIDPWVYDVATENQSHNAMYLGLRQKFIDQKPNGSPEFVTQMFRPEELAAWMRLFWDWYSAKSFTTRSAAEFINTHGSNENNYI
jgi:hypothetical protein